MATIKINRIHQEEKPLTWNEIQTRPGIYKVVGMDSTYLLVKDKSVAVTDYQASTKFLIISDSWISSSLVMNHSNWKNNKFIYVGKKIDLTIEVTDAY